MCKIKFTHCELRKLIAVVSQNNTDASYLVIVNKWNVFWLRGLAVRQRC